MASKDGSSFKEMIQRVLERFDHSELPEGSLGEHWRIRSSCAEGMELNDRLRKTKDRLLEVNSSTAIITRQLLIKSNAIGNSSLPGKDRFHVCCQFENGEEVFVFVARTATLSDLLEFVANKLPQLAFKSAIRPEGQCLVILTPDCDDWHLWDRRRVLSEAIKEFELVNLRPMATQDVVVNQALLVEVLLSCQKAEEEEALASKATDPLPSTDFSVLFQKGDRVLYSGSEECQVVGVHLDTLPDVYYTIRLSDGRERQTIQSKVELIQPSEPLPTDQGGIHLRVDWAGVHFDIRGVDPAMTIRDLKVYIQRCAPREAHLRLTDTTKLVCKGSTLSDKKLISSTKLKGGSKIMLIG